VACATRLFPAPRHFCASRHFCFQPLTLHPTATHSPPHSRSLSSLLLSLHSHCRSQPSASCHFCFQPHSLPHSRSLSSPLLSLHSRCRSQALTLFSEQLRFSDDDFLHCNFRISVLVSLFAQGVIQGIGIISFVIYLEA
jgi:hypothetical protein